MSDLPDFLNLICYISYVTLLNNKLITFASAATTTNAAAITFVSTTTASGNKITYNFPSISNCVRQFAATEHLICTITTTTTELPGFKILFQDHA